MSTTALTHTAGTRIMIGEKSITEIEPQQLIAPELQESADALVEQSEVIELVVNTSAEEAGGKLLKALSTFEKEQVQLCAIDVAPLEAAAVKRKTARDLLLMPIRAEKERIRGLLEVFGKQQALKRQEEERLAQAEAARIRREAAELEQQRIAAEKAAQEEAARLAREKAEAEAKAERERQAAAAEQERLKREREAAERANSPEAIAAAKKAQAEAKAKAEEEEKARQERQAKADREYAEEKARNEAAAKRQQETFKLQQAELTNQAVEASKVAPVSKPAGLSGVFKWKAKPEDESTPEIIQACCAKAYAVHPEFFDLVPKLRVIEAALKAKNGNMTIPGLTVYQDFTVKPK